MSSIYKIITFLLLSFLIAYISIKIQSNFIDTISTNIIGLLTTLFAINIASSTLVAGKLSEISNKTGRDFPNTKSNLRISFNEQIILIVLTFVVGIVRESCLLKTYMDVYTLKLICDSLLIFAFIYYLDILKDIGKALYNLLDANYK
jgi:hypothetical protein